MFASCNALNTCAGKRDLQRYPPFNIFGRIGAIIQRRRVATSKNGCGTACFPPQCFIDLGEGREMRGWLLPSFDHALAPVRRTASPSDCILSEPEGYAPLTDNVPKTAQVRILHSRKQYSE